MKTLVSIVGIALALGLGGLVTGCHEEPTIVIKFEPNAPSPSPTPVAVAVVATPAPKAANAATHTKGECKSDGDCLAVPVECCTCLKGGKQEAVSKKEALVLKSAHEKECKGMMCAMIVSPDPTCKEKAACVAGQCTLVEKAAKAK